jgi:hypothetical protein
MAENSQREPMKQTAGVLSTALNGFPAFRLTDALARIASIADDGLGKLTTVRDRSRRNYVLGPRKYPIKSAPFKLAMRAGIQATPWGVA